MVTMKSWMYALAQFVTSTLHRTWRRGVNKSQFQGGTSDGLHLRNSDVFIGNQCRHHQQQRQQPQDVSHPGWFALHQGAGLSISSLIELHFSCQLECIHTLIWECVYRLSLKYFVPNFVCNKNSVTKIGPYQLLCNCFHLFYSLVLYIYNISTIQS